MRSDWQWTASVPSLRPKLCRSCAHFGAGPYPGRGCAKSPRALPNLACPAPVLRRSMVAWGCRWSPKPCFWRSCAWCPAKSPTASSSTCSSPACWSICPRRGNLCASAICRTCSAVAALAVFTCIRPMHWQRWPKVVSMPGPRRAAGSSTVPMNGFATATTRTSSLPGCAPKRGRCVMLWWSVSNMATPRESSKGRP
ncbi:hypothetical protein D3C75_682950 [compost metagenome]